MILAGGKGQLIRREDRATLGSDPSALRAVKRLSPGLSVSSRPALPLKAKTLGEADTAAFFRGARRTA